MDLQILHMLNKILKENVYILFGSKILTHNFTRDQKCQLTIAVAIEYETP